MPHTNAKMLPNPRTKNPLVFPNGLHDEATVFLSEVIDHPNIEIAWWDWGADKIAANIALIEAGDVKALAQVAK